MGRVVICFCVEERRGRSDLKQKVTQSKTHYNDGVFFLAGSGSKRAEVSQK